MLIKKSNKTSLLLTTLR